MFGDIKQRFFIYPFLSMIIWLIAFTKYRSSEFISEIEHYFIQPYLLALQDIISIPFYVFITVFGFLFGYVYGTLSIIIKVRHMRGIVSIIVILIIKVTASVFGVAFACFLFPIEFLMIPLRLFIQKKIRFKKKAKEDLYLINQIRKIIKEENEKGENNYETSRFI